MGTKIKAKFEGMCKNCGEEWHVGNEICYQKDPKAICSDEECFKAQGGSLEFRSNWNKPSQQTSFYREKIKFNLPQVEVPEGITQSAETLVAVITKANQLAKMFYPELDSESQVFGQIRSKLVDQLLVVIFNENTTR
tara:strand:- start:883 stop:1293 length:411 start_codon:yes stop_codon:yes gene_type:complete